MSRRGGTGAGAVAGPPRLTLPVWRNLGVMAVANLLPLAALGWFFIGYDPVQGLHLRPHAAGLTSAIVAVVAACAMIALAAWVLMPLARWLRAYPRWRLRHSRLWYLWLLPVALGDVTWLAVMSVAVVVVALSIVVVALSIASLAR